MLPLQFFGQNLHFAICLFAALVFFAVFWLYFDAWTAEKHKTKKDTFKWLGFLLLAISFVVQSTIIEQSDLGSSLTKNSAVATFLSFLGLASIIIGQLIDPLQSRPQTKGIEDELRSQTATKLPAASGTSSALGTIYLLPVGALAVAALYWRRATTGLERHLKPVAIAFFLFFGFELLSLASLARNTDNPNVYNLVKAFGPVWIAAYVLLLASIIVLGRWVWAYLTERFMSQLFMVFTTAILVIFLLTTLSFTTLLMRNIQNDSLDNLRTAGNVLSYAIDSKKAQTAANAEIVAENPQVIQAISAKDHASLAKLTSDFLHTKKQSALEITDGSAQVLLRAQDPEKWGDSISSDSLIRRALLGKNVSTLTTAEGVLAPVMYIKTSVPVRASDNTIIGTVSVSLVADNSLVDGIKSATGLDSAIYSGNTLSATTFVAPDGKSRLVGVKINNGQINNQVLKQGKDFSGELDILNRPFLANYKALKDVNNNVVGMLFIGQPQLSILRTAGHSIELTFIVSAILLVLAVIPAYFTARHLSRQLS